mgnify:CR=1
MEGHQQYKLSHHRCCVLMQDGGDPDVAVSPRDIVYTLDASEAAAAAAKGVELAPEVLATTDLRCGGVSWCDGKLAACTGALNSSRPSRCGHVDGA